ncbi:hypothetical protein KUCAC02_023124 [Chaenocephalus aceratus]|uniref:Uncharacterized protein n=1 Tax=Chaenocephalus aceratus TaxID=36190 RepID=A0ACB9XQE1_CHAAC|nr:hypothetical protein KUCAC02_023124 [Chaenocephalus aceratus]
MTFTATCKEARALEQELHDGEDAILSQRVTAPTTQNSNLQQLKGQIQAELQQGLMGEMRKEIAEQIKAFSGNLMEEMRKQFSTKDVLPTPKSPTRNRHHHTTETRFLQARRRQADRSTPCCGAAGHVQRQCPHGSSGTQDF